MHDPPHTADPSYAFGRLQAAIRTAETHPSAEVRERARAKAEAWLAILEGMRTGELTVGSRTPVANTPAWVTLEVAHGGFATGRYVAEGELLEHEQARLAGLPADAPGTTAREKLNISFLTNDGLRELLGMVRAGAYRVDIPEEGALPTVAWLLHEGRDAEAVELVATLRPLMHRLRFYPRPADPRASGTMVHVATAGEIAKALRSVSIDRRVAMMNATLAVWTPLFDRLVSLWLDTVEGEAPSLRHVDGSLARRADGQPEIVGGWPCRRWPSDWSERRELWLADFTAAERAHSFTGKHASRKGNFLTLARALERCPHDAHALGPRDVGRIRHALAGTVARHGAPGSERRVRVRAEQLANASRPLFADIAAVVAARLAEHPKDEGVSAIDPLVESVHDGESERVPAGTPIPASYAGKVARALEAPLEELVERGIIGSAEVLALVLPQMTAGIVAARIADPTARALYAQIYASFRRRRSLLLLHLEHQVQIEELPWVAALGAVRSATSDTRAAARLALAEVSEVALTRFPQTIVPNRLVREMSALAREAGMKLPLVEEVAADIFMGTFTEKWSQAADVATRVLRGTLYARYYDLPDTPAPRSLLERWGKRTDDAFARRCRERAAEAGSGGSWVAGNGAILEQSQILTTHNLAVLVDELGLDGLLRERGARLAIACMEWVVARQAQQAPDARNRLRSVKNCAYAWRQALFFASFADDAGQHAVLGALEARVAEQSIELRARLGPVVQGLRHVLTGGRFDSSGRAHSGARRFLGWSRGRHWLAPS